MRPVKEKQPYKEKETLKRDILTRACGMCAGSRLAGVEQSPPANLYAHEPSIEYQQRRQSSDALSASAA